MPPTARGHREPTTILAHYLDTEAITLTLLIRARRDVDVATAEVRRCQTMLDFSLNDPDQPPEATRVCREAVEWAQARLDTARARVATLEDAIAKW